MRSIHTPNTSDKDIEMNKTGNERVVVKSREFEGRTIYDLYVDGKIHAAAVGACQIQDSYNKAYTAYPRTWF